MEIRVLRYFLMVAREESITRAAVMLHITQPTLSRQLIQLEEELGVSLFHRGRQRIMLTEEGMLLKYRAQEIVELADKTKREFSPEGSTLAGDVSIGCGETGNMDYIAKLITDFRRLHPLVKFEIFSGNALNVRERIDNGLLDFGMMIEPVDVGSYDFKRLPCKEKWALLVRADSPLAQKEHIVPKDLVGTPLMVSSRDKVKNVFANWCGEYYDKMNIIAEHNLYLNAAVMVRSGMAAFIGLNFDDFFQGLKEIPLKPEIELGLVMTWKRGRAFSKAAKAFIDFIKHTD